MQELEAYKQWLTLLTVEELKAELKKQQTQLSVLEMKKRLRLQSK
jgi:hypothetical protein